MSVVPDFGKIVVYDTEFTSWAGFMEKGLKEEGRYPEIIQIGAVALDAHNGLVEIASFSTLIRPTINPDLSDYIQNLTNISQADVDADGVPFSDALARFLSFVPEDATAMVCHGEDGKILQMNCDLNNISHPEHLPDEIDLNRFLRTNSLIDQAATSSTLPTAFGLESEGEAHNALDDARALASVLRELRKLGHL